MSTSNKAGNAPETITFEPRPLTGERARSPRADDDEVVDFDQSKDDFSDREQTPELKLSENQDPPSPVRKYKTEDYIPFMQTITEEEVVAMGKWCRLPHKTKIIADFKTNRGLKNHLWTQHGVNTGEYAIHVCSECKREFPLLGSYKQHMIKVHGIKMTLCEYCGQTFRSELYRLHVQENH